MSESAGGDFTWNENMQYFHILQTKILWIDEKNLTGCFECGIVGQDLERRVSRWRLVSWQTTK